MLASNTVFYDATHPTHPPGLGGCAFAILFIAGGLAIIRYPRLSGGRDLSLNRAMGAFTILFGGAMLFASAVPFFTALQAQSILRSGHPEVIEGCVQRYENQIGDHEVADTDFSIGATRFHFNSSPWAPGFHNAGAVIRLGERLKITRSGNFVIRVEALPGACAIKS